jgi:hypothetical protein
VAGLGGVLNADRLSGFVSDSPAAHDTKHADTFFTEGHQTLHDSDYSLTPSTDRQQDTDNVHDNKATTRRKQNTTKQNKKRGITKTRTISQDRESFINFNSF